MSKKILQPLFILSLILAFTQANLALAADQLPPSLNTQPITTSATTTTTTPETTPVTTTVAPATTTSTTTSGVTSVESATIVPATQPTSTTIAPTTVPATRAFEDFKDVSTNHPDYNAIIVLRYKNILSGYDDNTFRPDQPLNRVEALKLIFEVAQIDVNTGIAPASFNDIAQNSWYTSYINKALFLEVVGGYPDGSFRPSKSVNLVEFLKMLEVAQKVDLTNTNLNQLPFTDIMPGQWYTKYINYAKINGLIEGDNAGKVYPEMPLTRARAAAIIYRFKNYKTRPLAATPPTSTVKTTAAVLTDKDYAIYVSASYKFAIQYPKKWFYSSLLADGTTVIRSYGFGPKDLTTNAAVVSLDLLPNDKDFTPNLVFKNLNFLRTIAKDGNVILSTKIEGSTRIYSLTGPIEQEQVMLTMLGSLTTEIEGLESLNTAEKKPTETTTTTTPTTTTTFSTSTPTVIPPTP